MDSGVIYQVKQAGLRHKHVEVELTSCFSYTDMAEPEPTSSHSADVSIFRRWFISVACIIISLSILSHHASLSDPLTPWYLGPCEKPGDQITPDSSTQSQNTLPQEVTMRGTILYANFMQPLWQSVILLRFSRGHLNSFDVNHFVRSCSRIRQLSSAAPSRVPHGNFQCCLSPAITEVRALSGPGHLMGMPLSPNVPGPCSPT